MTDATVALLLVLIFAVFALVAEHGWPWGKR